MALLLVVIKIRLKLKHKLTFFVINPPWSRPRSVRRLQKSSIITEKPQKLHILHSFHFLVLVLINIFPTFLNGFAIQKLLQNHGIMANKATSAKSRFFSNINGSNSAIFHKICSSFIFQVKSVEVSFVMLKLRCVGKTEEKRRSIF